ncbi:MAG: hypothetical protein LC777_18460, partial [Actinobacteria bacterium]|nr:hypothetical protein [Actinomycetota bacterium]
MPDVPRIGIDRRTAIDAIRTASNPARRARRPDGQWCRRPWSPDLVEDPRIPKRRVVRHRPRVAER